MSSRPRLLAAVRRGTSSSVALLAILLSLTASLGALPAYAQSAIAVPPPVPVATQPPVGASRAGYDDMASTSEADPEHDGHSRTSLPKSPTLLWSQVPGIMLRSPIIADGRVFVQIWEPDKPTQVRAYSLRTGLPLWTVQLPYHSAGLTYDRGRLFTASASYYYPRGLTEAWEPITGTRLWSVEALGEYAEVSAPPVARDGRVIISGGQSIAALDELTGIVLWRQYVLYSAQAALTVTATEVVDNSPAGAIRAWDPATGELLWWHADSSNDVPVPVYKGKAYLKVADPGGGAHIDVVDVKTNATVRTEAYRWGVTTFDHDKQFRVDYPGALTAVDDATGDLLWTANKADYVNPALAVDTRVFAVAKDGRVDGLDQATGAVVWSGPKLTPDLTTFGSPRGAAIAAAQGVLLVMVNNELRAYGDPAALLPTA